MSVTKWRWIVFVITKNKELGQALAELAAAFPNDPNAETNTFVDRLQTTPQGWVVALQARANFVDVVVALNEDVDILDPRLDELRNRGLTASTWGQAKQNLIAEIHQVWLEDGTYVPCPTLEEFCTSNGYTLLETPETP